MTTACDLTNKKCKPCEGVGSPLTEPEIQKLLLNLNDWQFVDGVITKTYKFKNYYEVMAFVNATAWVSNREDHHPDILLGFNECKVSYVTHAIKGLSENDFICAAKIDALFAL
jgi:4a-hydroxytetrahydrobiopterin dehydratase